MRSGIKIRGKLQSFRVSESRCFDRNSPNPAKGY